MSVARARTRLLYDSCRLTRRFPHSFNSYSSTLQTLRFDLPDSRFFAGISVQEDAPVIIWDMDIAAAKAEKEKEKEQNQKANAAESDSESSSSDEDTTPVLPPDPRNQEEVPTSQNPIHSNQKRGALASASSASVASAASASAKTNCVPASHLTSKSLQTNVKPAPKFMPQPPVFRYLPAANLLRDSKWAIGPAAQQEQRRQAQIVRDRVERENLFARMAQIDRQIDPWNQRFPIPKPPDFPPQLPPGFPVPPPAKLQKPAGFPDPPPPMRLVPTRVVLNSGARTNYSNKRRTLTFNEGPDKKKYKKETASLHNRFFDQIEKRDVPVPLFQHVDGTPISIFHETDLGKKHALNTELLRKKEMLSSTFLQRSLGMIRTHGNSQRDQSQASGLLFASDSQNSALGDSQHEPLACSQSSSQRRPMNEYSYGAFSLPDPDIDDPFYYEPVTGTATIDMPVDRLSTTIRGSKFHFVKHQKKQKYLLEPATVLECPIMSQKYVFSNALLQHMEDDAIAYSYYCWWFNNLYSTGNEDRLHVPTLDHLFDEQKVDEIVHRKLGGDKLLNEPSIQFSVEPEEVWEFGKELKMTPEFAEAMRKQSKNMNTHTGAGNSASSSISKFDFLKDAYAAEKSILTGEAKHESACADGDDLDADDHDPTPYGREDDLLADYDGAERDPDHVYMPAEDFAGLDTAERFGMVNDSSIMLSSSCRDSFHESPVEVEELHSLDMKTSLSQTANDDSAWDTPPVPTTQGKTHTNRNKKLPLKKRLALMQTAANRILERNKSGEIPDHCSRTNRGFLLLLPKDRYEAEERLLSKERPSSFEAGLQLPFAIKDVPLQPSFSEGEVEMNSAEQQRDASIFHIVEDADYDTIVLLIIGKLPKKYRGSSGRDLPIYYCPPKRHKKPVIAMRGISAVTAKTVLSFAAGKLDQAYKEVCRTLENGIWAGLCWRVKNSKQAIQRLCEGNYTKVFGYDFATMYDCLPHSMLAEVLEYCVTLAFRMMPKKKLVLTVRRDEHGNAKRVCRFVTEKEKGKNDVIITEKDLTNLTKVVIFNNFIAVHGLILRQTRGVPQGLNCSPTWTCLFLCFFEVRFQKRNKHLNFNGFIRYIDDLCTRFNLHTTKIYPEEFQILPTALNVTSHQFLDVESSIINKRLCHRIYDKRRDFNFPLCKYTDVSSCIPIDCHAHHFKSALIRFYGLNDFIVFFIRDIIECVGFFHINRSYRMDFVHRALTSVLDRHRERKWCIPDVHLIRKMSILVNKVYILMIDPPRLKVI